MASAIDTKMQENGSRIFFEQLIEYGKEASINFLEENAYPNMPALWYQYYQLQVLVKNLFDVGQGYSGNIYDMENSLKGGVLYPALDPSIFEVKFPNSDIKGKVLGDNLGIVE